MIDQGLLLIFSVAAIWLTFTTPEQRQAWLGYLILLAVISALLSLLTGQGPNSHYGAY